MIKVGQFSTWKEHCGVARNAHSVAGLLGEYVEIVPLPLKRSIMQGNQDIYEHRIANLYFKSLLEQANKCDVIIWQHEPGLLGARKLDYLRRSKLISKLNKPIIIVFHTIPRNLNILSLFNELFLAMAAKPGRSTLQDIRIKFGNFSRAFAWQMLFRHTAKAISRNGVAIIHTEEDAKYIQLATKIPKNKIVVAAPSNITPEMEEYRSNLNSGALKVNAGSRVQNIFQTDSAAFWISYVGFLNDYKGLDYIIETLKLLPNNFNLIIAGSVHERSADDYVDSHPLTKNFLELFDLDPIQVMDRVKSKTKASNKQQAQRQKGIPPAILSRIHLVSSPSDIEIAETILGSNAVSLMYRNINQSASGPLVEALELGATAVASNNRLFRRYKEFAGNQLLLVDVGNIVQARDEFLRLSKQAKIIDVSGNRLVTYPWTKKVDFRHQFRIGYIEAFEKLKLTSVSESLRTQGQGI
jgi:glycosyltransferase involved in cell wall biosynthesis